MKNDKYDELLEEIDDLKDDIEILKDAHNKLAKIVKSANLKVEPDFEDIILDEDDLEIENNQEEDEDFNFDEDQDEKFSESKSIKEESSTIKEDFDL